MYIAMGESSKGPFDSREYAVRFLFRPVGVRIYINVNFITRGALGGRGGGGGGGGGGAFSPEDPPPMAY